jgi:hypothetical protein
MAEAVDLFIHGQPDRVRPLLQAARRYLHETAPGLTEALKWRVPTFMHGRNLFYLNPQADHVVLGFFDGAAMKEFHGVFDAVLAEVAHVKVRTAEDLRRPGLREAVRVAAGFRDVDIRERERPPEPAPGRHEAHGEARAEA